MRTALDYFKEARPEHWADADKVSVDFMLELMDSAIKDVYNKALEDAANNVKDECEDCTYCNSGRGNLLKVIFELKKK